MKSDIIFLVVAVAYLFIRDWPFGEGMQPITDVLFLITTWLVIIKYLKKQK